MLRLHRQLNRLRENRPPILKPSKPSDPRVIELRRRIETLISEKKAVDEAKADHDCDDRIDGSEIGELRVIQTSFAPDHKHGDIAVASCLKVSAERLARWCFDDVLADLDVSRLLFLDTETTGLHGGAGTLAFLVGLAWFDEGCLQVEQLMLDNPSLESEQLTRLKERLDSASGIVTYNGRRFDWPLLCNRFVLNRMAPPVIEHHIDLLSPARRIYKRRFESVRLVRIETEVLGFERIDDVDGSEIPARYWEYVRSGNPDLIDPVLEHNVHDLVALAAMMGQFDQQYLGQGTAYLDDAISVAKLAIKVSDIEHGLNLATELLSDEDVQIRDEAALLIAKVHQRHGDYLKAVQILESVLTAQEASSEVYLALAKLYEHKIKDLQIALEHAQSTEDSEGREAHQKRCERLKRRLRRSLK